MLNNSKANPGHEESLRAEKKQRFCKYSRKKVVYVEGFRKKRQSENYVTGSGVEIILVRPL